MTNANDRHEYENDVENRCCSSASTQSQNAECGMLNDYVYSRAVPPFKAHSACPVTTTTTIPATTCGAINEMKHRHRPNIEINSSRAYTKSCAKQTQKTPIAD